MAAKTHYFCELAVVPTVRALLRHCPAFWTSQPWLDCLRPGTFLELDRQYFGTVRHCRQYSDACIRCLCRKKMATHLLLSNGAEGHRCGGPLVSTASCI